MSNYRRAFVSGRTWFFTVNLLERNNNDLLVREIDLFREAIRRVQQKNPFHIDAWVVLPEYMHCVFTLPPGAGLAVFNISSLCGIGRVSG